MSSPAAAATVPGSVNRSATASGPQQPLRVAIASVVSPTTTGGGGDVKNPPTAATTAVGANAVDPESFDVAKRMNELFPDEASLSQTDEVLLQLSTQIKQLDTQLRDLLHSQTDAGARASLEVEQCRTAIRALFQRIKMIREQAAASEAMVHEITRDIKTLDRGKRNLLDSLGILKRLQMLVTAMDHLRTLMAGRQYAEAVDIFKALLALADYFHPYKNVAQIAVLCERVIQFRTDVRRQIFQDFDSAFVAGTLRNTVSLLNDACLIIEVLGPETRHELIDWYCDVQLKDYRAIFTQNTEVAGLDTVSRRYAWLKRLLKTYDDEHATVFPPVWRVAERLCEKFCLDTRADIAAVLAKTEYVMDVKVMLQSLQQTMEFEGKVDGRFAPTRDVGGEPARLAESSNAGTPPNVQAPPKFLKIISSCYEPYLRLYIESEDRNLSNMMDGYRTSTQTQEDESVLMSSTDLFLFYRQTLLQCSRFSTNKPFLDLCRLFGKWLRVYADVLSTKLPRDDKKAYTDEEIRMTCLVINTADYCSQTTAQLEEKLIEKIDEKFKTTVSFAQEIEGFLNVTNNAIKSLVRIVEVFVEPALNVMVRRPWGTMESVGDQSEYVTQIGTAISAPVTLIRKTLAGQKYLRTFWDKVSEAVLVKFHANVYKCKPISEVGAEQMLLDTHALKTTLIQMTNLGSDAEGGPVAPGTKPPPPPAAYLKILGKGVQKIEQLLKVVLRNPEPPTGIVETFVLLFPDSDATALQKILELKGLKRSEQQVILETYYQRTGTSPSSAGSQGGPNSSSSSSTGNSGFDRASLLGSAAAGSNIMQSAFASGAGGKFKENLNRFSGMMQGFKRQG